MAFRLVMRFKRDKELRSLCHLFLKELGTLASAVEAQGEKGESLAGAMAHALPPLAGKKGLANSTGEPVHGYSDRSYAVEKQAPNAPPPKIS